MEARLPVKELHNDVRRLYNETCAAIIEVDKQCGEAEKHLQARQNGTLSSLLGKLFGSNEDSKKNRQVIDQGNILLNILNRTSDDLELFDNDLSTIVDIVTRAHNAVIRSKESLNDYGAKQVTLAVGVYSNKPMLDFLLHLRLFLDSVASLLPYSTQSEISQQLHPRMYLSSK